MPPTSETNGWTAVVGLHVARIGRSDPYRQTDETCEDIVSGQSKTTLMSVVVEKMSTTDDDVVVTNGSRQMVILAR